MSWLSKAARDPVSVLSPVTGGIKAVTGLSAGQQMAIGAGIGMGAKRFGALGAAGGPSPAGQNGAQGSSGGFDWKSLIPSVAGVAGDIYSARTLASGQEAANQSGLASSREQMQFQERMSSTAHQREVEDLKRAGLNPALSANSGASTPVGSSADFSNAAPDFSGIGSRAVGSAVQVKQLMKDLQEADSRIEMNRANKILAGDRSREARSSALSQDIRNRRDFMEYEWDVNHPHSYNFRRRAESLAPAAATARDIAVTYGASKVGKKSRFNLDNLRERGSDVDFKRGLSR